MSKKDNLSTLKVNILLISKRIFPKNHKKVSIPFSNRKRGMPRVLMFYVH